MNYNKLNTYSEQEIKNELTKQKRNLRFSIAIIILLFIFVTFLMFKSGQISWILIIPVSYLTFIIHYNSFIIHYNSYIRALNNEVLQREK